MVHRDDAAAGGWDLLPVDPVVLGRQQQRRLHDDDHDRPRPATLLLQLADLRHPRLPLLPSVPLASLLPPSAPGRMPTTRPPTARLPVTERIVRMSHTFALLVPVKALSLAKSRLSVPEAGAREPLMRAFALDAIAAAVRSPAVAQVHVVTDEPGFDVDGAQVDSPTRATATSTGRCTTPRCGCGCSIQTSRVAAMCADLPSLRTGDLTDALSAGLTPRWFVADAAGTGTTLLAAGTGRRPRPALRVGSARRHEESGAAPVRAELPLAASGRGHRGRPDCRARARCRRAHGSGARRGPAVTRCPGR